MNEPNDAANTVQWRTSSYTNGGGNCVEVGVGHPHLIPVRDTKVRDGSAVVVSQAAFAAFVDAVREH